eukprot:1026363_1
MTSTQFKHLLNENVFDFVERTRKLLSVEKQDDIALLEEAYSHYTLKQLEEQGLCLRRIQITDIHTGLYGRSIVKFALHTNQDEHSSIDHKFTVGDIIKFVDNEKIQGVICKSYRNQLKIAINDGVSFEIGKDLVISHKYSLLLLIDTITYKKYDQILSILSKPSIGIGTNIRNLLFTPMHLDQDTNSEHKHAPPIDFDPINKTLNQSQLNAIQCALNANDIFLIHGPPGTGKTTTIIELIYQSLIHQKRSTTNKKFQILACAPSNIAVDNMVEKLSSTLYGQLINMVRIGHPARILDSVVSHCLESLLRSNAFKHDGKQLVDDIRQEIKHNVKLLNTKNKDKKQRYLIYDELKQLRRELKKYEEKMVNGILDHVDVVLCTLCGASRRELKDKQFDLCIIDEAGQSLEVACWIAMTKCKKVILCGDHLQLAPTVKSKDAKELSYTLFDKLQGKFKHEYPPKIAMLDTQYRMNDVICRYFSDALYEGKLKSHESVAHHVLRDLEYMKTKEAKQSRCAERALMMVDSAGIDGFEEDVVDAHKSKSNRNEAEIVCTHVQLLLNAGIKARDIAVITPYRGQVKVLREMMHDEVEIGTVDGFQGREKEAIVVSFVRSNDEHVIGFLRDDRRTNVAITRARRHCCLFLNSETLERHSFLKQLTDYCYDRADIRTADEYLGEEWEVMDQFVEMEEVKTSRDNAVKKTKERAKIKGNNESKKKGMNRAQKKHWRKKQKMNKTVHTKQEDIERNDDEMDVKETQKDVLSLLSVLDEHTNDDNVEKKTKKNIKYKARNTKRYHQQKQMKHQKKQKILKTQISPKKKTQSRNKMMGKKENDLSDVLVDVNPKRCYFKGCKKKVHVLRVQCKFCARIFCMHHGPAIFHSEECAKKYKFKIEEKKKESLKEIDKIQYNERNNIKELKPGQRKQIAQTLREKIQAKQNNRIQKSVRNNAKKNQNKNKRKSNKKIPKRKK